MEKSFKLTFEWKDYFSIANNTIRQKENSEIEFKENFHSPKQRDKSILKWIASFANARGGLIIYGVRNNGGICGLKNNKMQNFDNKDLTQELNRFFAPKIDFEVFMQKIKGKDVGFIYIHESGNKPIIAKTSDDKKIKEGDIFYRYPGESKRIEYGELIQMINQREKSVNEKWMATINNIATIGVENVGIFNLNNGELSGSKNKLIFPEKLLDKVKFINEGHFVEKEGAPALKLLGEVVPADSNKVIKVVENNFQIITHFELYQVFFKQNLTKDNALDFFRQVTYESSYYFPIYYYLKIADISTYKAIETLGKEKGSKVENLKQRLREEQSNTNKFESGNISTGTDAAKNIESYINQLKNKNEIDYQIDTKDLRHLIQAITHLKRSEIELNYILDVLKKIYDTHFMQRTLTRSFIRKAICHIDLVFFGSEIFQKESN